jgi:Domain of unknown function (DUF4386)
VPGHSHADDANRLARTAGAMYLLTMVTALFGEGYVRGSLLVGDSAAQTAQNIIDSRMLFRIGLATDLLTFTGVVILVWSLHQLLRPVGTRAAMLAACFRLVELGIHFSAVAFGYAAASLLSGGEYVKGFSADQLAGLAGFALRAQGAGLTIGFIPLGIGSTIFAWLLLRSGYAPKALAVWGIFASLLLSTYALAWVITPDTTDYFYFAMLPMFAYEVGLGFWLLVRGAGIKATGSASEAE